MTLIRAGTVLGALVLGGGLSSCGRLLAFDGAPVPEEQWDEVFDFEMRPGTMNAAEAQQLIEEQTSPQQIIPGSAGHRGSVDAPGGTVDFFVYRMIDPELGPQPVVCTSTVASSYARATCGNEELETATQPVQVAGESWGGLWAAADLLVEDDVVRVEAVADDGTSYTITPLDGFGYVEWLDGRGSLELVAYDVQGQELGRTFVGLDR